MDKVRFGVIGIGNMGSGHCRTLWAGDVSGGVLAAVCDKKPERLLWAKKEFPGIGLFDTPEALFASGLIDAVLIAVPHYDHPTLSMAAFSHKLHVLCEKPAGVYTKKVREMNQAAVASGMVFGMMFNQRTNPLYIKMHDMIEENALGELKRTNWIITNWYRCQYYYDSGDWRATWAGEGGGVLLNQCPHNLDLWQWICGMPISVRAFCHEGNWRDIEVEDDVTAYVEYENGATGVFITCTADAPGTNRLEITGDKGKLVCENDALTFYKLKTPESKLNAESREAFIKPEYEILPIPVGGENPQHKGVIQAFVHRILKGTPLIAEGTEGIHGLELSNAMHLSSWLDKTINLPLDEDLFLSELNKKIQHSKQKERVVSADVADLSGTY